MQKHSYNQLYMCVMQHALSNVLTAIIMMIQMWSQPYWHVRKKKKDSLTVQHSYPSGMIQLTSDLCVSPFFNDIVLKIGDLRGFFFILLRHPGLFQSTLFQLSHDPTVSFQELQTPLSFSQNLCLWMMVKLFVWS